MGHCTNSTWIHILLFYQSGAYCNLLQLLDMFRILVLLLLCHCYTMSTQEGVLWPYHRTYIYIHCTVNCSAHVMHADINWFIYAELLFRELSGHNRDSLGFWHFGVQDRMKTLSLFLPVSVCVLTRWNGKHGCFCWTHQYVQIGYILYPKQVLRQRGRWD